MRANVKHGDRTGLVTVHPELFDENGNIAEKEFLVVNFKRSKPTLPWFAQLFLKEFAIQYFDDLIDAFNFIC